jgi:hypothetical protein
MKRRTIIGVIQIGSFIGFGGLLLFIWAPWFSCRPVNELDLAKYGVQSVPAGARCFSMSHGNVVFHTHGTAADDAGRFALLSLALVVLFCVVNYTYFKYADSPLARLGPRLRRTVTTIRMSDRPSDKLQALAVSSFGNGDSDAFSVEYREACTRWFAALSPDERIVAHDALAAFVRDDEPAASRLVRSLPAAPTPPLL